jgi:hypothetical protein
MNLLKIMHGGKHFGALQEVNTRISYNYLEPHVAGTVQSV